MPTEQEFISGAFKAGLNPQQVSQAVQVFRQSHPRPNPIVGLVGGIAKGIAQPFINTGKNIGGAGYELFRGAKSALGDQGAYVNPDTGEVVQNPFLNEKELTKVSQPLSLQNGSALRQQIGDSANIVSYAVPFGKGANLATKALIPGATVGFLNSVDANANPGSIAAGTVGGTLFAGATHLTGNALKKLPNYLKNQSDQVVTRGIGNPAKQTELEKKAGRTVASFFKEYNLLDRSPETATTVKNNIGSKYSDFMINSGKSAKTGDIINAIDKKIIELETGPGKFSDANNAMKEELLRRRGQFLETIGADATQSPLSSKISDVGLFRREALDPDIPKSMFGLDARGSGKAQGAKEVRDVLMEKMNATDPRLNKLGRDYGMAKGIEDILTKAQSRVGNRQILNFSKLGSAGLGGIIGGAPGAVAGFAGEQVVNHPSFIKGMSNALSGASKVQSSINKSLSNPVVKNVIYQGSSRVGSLTNLPFQTREKKYQIQGSLRKLPVPETYAPSSKQSITEQSASMDSIPTTKESQKALRYKPAKNVFNNRSSFGKSFKLKGSA